MMGNRGLRDVDAGFQVANAERIFATREALQNFETRGIGEHPEKIGERGRSGSGAARCCRTPEWFGGPGHCGSGL